MLPTAPAADLVEGATFASGRVAVVEALEAAAGTPATEEPAKAVPVAAREVPALVVSVVAGSAVAEVVCGGSAAAPRIVVWPGRLASFRDSGRGAAVDGAVAVGGVLVAGSSGRRSDAWRWIKL
ncbi:MAG TPA: hypothetical protein VFQ06_12920 [Nitrospira sp.]|nr:hypothetical protein [Nitrospira sp.]